MPRLPPLPWPRRCSTLCTEHGTEHADCRHYGNTCGLSQHKFAGESDHLPMSGWPSCRAKLHGSRSARGRRRPIPRGSDCSVSRAALTTASRSTGARASRPASLHGFFGPHRGVIPVRCRSASSAARNTAMVWFGRSTHLGLTGGSWPSSVRMRGLGKTIALATWRSRRRLVHHGHVTTVELSRLRSGDPRLLPGCGGAAEAGAEAPGTNPSQAAKAPGRRPPATMSRLTAAVADLEREVGPTRSGLPGSRPDARLSPRSALPTTQLTRTPRSLARPVGVPLPSVAVGLNATLLPR